MSEIKSSETGGLAGVLDGAKIAEEIKLEVAGGVREFVARYDTNPCLAVVRVGDDAASQVYVRGKVRTSEQLGFRSEHHHLSADTTTDELLAVVDNLNARDDVDGILVQLPLPQQIDEMRIIESVNPAKDVDGFHPLNVGRLVTGQTTLAPCTPAGIIELLKRYNIKIKGARACVVGRSNIVGRPLAQMLLQLDATITICHSRTEDLASVAREADILIAAVGRAGIISGEYVKRGATVVDVGMNNLMDENSVDRYFEGEEAKRRRQAIATRGYTLIGDVNPLEVRRQAKWLTPVPGGVGPLTIAMLMHNTLTAANLRRYISR